MSRYGAKAVKIGNQLVGPGQPIYVIGEIGINHNGSLDIAKQLIEGAAKAGCSAVKFQKRTPEVCVPRDQWEIERDTPWGRMTYIDYKARMEFTRDEFQQIEDYCKELGIHWFASCWDEPSVDFMEHFEPVAYKAASASLTDIELLKKMKATGRPLMISTGMSTMKEIEAAVAAVGEDNLLIFHSTSAYPCKLEELNLRVIETLQKKYPSVPIGYSGHETGIVPACAAVALGASFVERHITLDRAMWGTDQAASLEMGGLQRMIQGFRDIEISLGDGEKRLYDSELGPRDKLRRVRPDKSTSREPETSDGDRVALQ